MPFICGSAKMAEGELAGGSQVSECWEAGVRPLQCSGRDSVTWPLTGLEEYWTMALIDGAGTVNGSAGVHEKHWLWLFHSSDCPCSWDTQSTLHSKWRRSARAPSRHGCQFKVQDLLTWKSLQEEPENGKLCIAGLASMLHAELCSSLEASALCECLRGS